MLIHNALLTGSITLNGSDVSNITGSADYSASFSSRITNNEATGSTLTAASSSFSTRVTGLEASSGSFSTRTTSLEASSGSFSTRTTNIERVYATTGSNTFTAAQVIQGTLTAQTLIVQTVTSSVLFSTGSNKLGNSLSNVQELTGSVGITGSLAVVTTGTEFQVNAGGVNIGNALTDNHIISGSLRVNPNGLFVSSSGNVGIGTTSPSTKLHVAGASPEVRIDATTGAESRLSFYDNGADKYDIFLTGGQLRTYGAAYGNYVQTIFSNGNIGIGTTTDSGYKLEVAGTMYVTNTFAANAKFSGYTTDGLFNANSRPCYIVGPGGGQAIRFGYNDYGGGQYYGRIGFPATTNWSLGIIGSAGNDFSIGTDYRGTNLYLYSNGNYSFTGSNVSDSRKKANINYITSSQLENILKLKPASFNQKGSDGIINSNTHTGFIAQDVIDAGIANLVHGSDEDGYGLDYYGVLALVVKAIQELKAEIDILKQQ